MHGFQKKALYFLLQKNTTALSVIICLMHAVLAPLCFSYNCDLLSRYHLYAVLLYTVVLILHKAVPDMFLFMLIYTESVAYVILITLYHGNDCGSYILTLALMVYMLVMVLTSKRPITITFLPSGITFFIIFAIQFLDFTYERAVTAFPIRFYLTHYCIYSFFSFFVMGFISFVVQKKTNRFQSKAAAINTHLTFSASHDALTKIYNRRKATQIIADFSSKPEYSATVFTTAIFDIDHFKKVNDTYGHDAGDIILKNVAGLIHRSLPDNTIFARWGGEEFIIVFIGSPNSAYNILEEIRERVEDQNFKYLDKYLKITITIGMSSHERSTKFSEMLIEADNNLLEGKRSGRNCVFTGEKK